MSGAPVRLYERGSVVGVKFVPKQIYGVGDPRYHPRQYVGEGYQFGKPTLCENYLSRDIGICAKLRCRFGEADPEEFYATFVDLHGSGITEADDLGGASEDIEAAIHLDSIAYRSNACKNDEQPVFISVVEFLDGGEDRVTRRWSMTRLYRRDEFLCGRANVAYQSLRTGLTEFFCRGVNGEEVPFLDRVAVPGNKGGKEMIETGCKVVDDFTGKNSEPIRDWPFAFAYKDIASAIVPEFRRMGIRWRIGSQEGSDLIVEVLDEFVGPLNFRSAPA